jgi:hypothetical protein
MTKRTGLETGSFRFGVFPIMVRANWLPISLIQYYSADAIALTKARVSGLVS